MSTWFMDVPLCLVVLPPPPKVCEWPLRHLIQYSTGYITGSVYFSELLYENGFPGENFDNGSAIVVKSHLNSFIDKDYP